METETRNESLQEIPKRKLTKAEKKAIHRTDYPEPLKTRRENFKALMLSDSDDRIERIKNYSFECFDEDFKSDLNIYQSVVDHFKAMPDKNKKLDVTLAGIYLNSFIEWLEARDDAKELTEKYLATEVQISAFKACSDSTHHYEIVASIFNLNNKNLGGILLEDIEKKLRKHEFKEAAEIIIKNDLKKRFSMQQLVIPLLLQDKWILAYQYMEGSPNLQREFVAWLDSFVDKTPIDVETMLKPWLDNKIMTVRVERFVGKSLEKYMNSIFNKVAKDHDFDVDCSRDTPRFESKKQDKALKHYVSTRYDLNVKFTISDDVYFQHVRSTLDMCNAVVVESFLHYLWSSNVEEKQIDAISWVKLLKMDVTSNCIPGKMRDFFHSNSNKTNLIDKADMLLKSRISLQMFEDGEPLYLFQDRHEVRIYMISNDAGLDHLCSQVKFFEQQDSDGLVGVDTEWKPAHLIKSSTMKIAIMQIFFGNSVYIVDCVELEKDVTRRSDTWIKFATRLFCSEKLKVIGFDFRNDIDALLTVKELQSSLKIEDIKNMFCLKRLTENVHDTDTNILDLVRRSFKLADLTEKLVGIQLNKVEQCSNWQSRPLRKDQVVYAAMDAYVVVEVYKTIEKSVREFSVERAIDFEKILAESNVLAPKKESGKKEKKLDLLKWQDIYNIIRDHRDVSKTSQRPYDISCIVDTMLFGFAKNLRRCGIDVMIPLDVKDFHEKLKTLKRYGGDKMRLILTVPSKSYEYLRNEYPIHTMAFPDITCKSALEQLTTFFDQFNIDIRPDDIFLRCVDCNSRHIVRFPGPVIHFLHQYLIIHLQNVYRADMSEFPFDEWYDRIEQLNPRDFGGIEVKISRPNESSNWIVATSNEGSLHITRNVIIHDSLSEGVEVRVNKVPDDVFQRSNLVFFICGECGKVMYDGKRVENGEKSISTTASISNESLQADIVD